MRFEYAGIVPSGYVVQERPDLRIMIPGIILFPISYALGQLWFLFLKWNPWSFVPLVGPLTQFFTMRGSVNFATQGEFNLGLISTIGQVLGVTAIVVGLVKPIRWLEKSPVAIVPSPRGVAVVGVF